MVAWAANFIVVKAANEQIPPVTFALLRFGVAAATLLLLVRWRDGTFGWPGRDALPILALGGVGFGIYQILWSIALQDIPAGDSALLIASTPVITLLAVRSGADVLTRTKLGGSALSFAGVGLIVASGPGIAFGAAIVGDLLTLLAAVCWSIYTAFGAPILRRHSPLRTTAWAMVGGSLVLLVPGLAQGVGAAWPAVTPGGLGWAPLLGIPARRDRQRRGLQRDPPPRPDPDHGLQFLVPFIAVLLGAAFLSEPMRIEQLLGGLVIVLGVAITRSDRVTTFGGWLRPRIPA